METRLELDRTKIYGKLTIELLQVRFGDNVGRAIEFAEAYNTPYPTRPEKPFHKIGLVNTDSKKLREYADALDIYEGELKIYKPELEAYQENKRKINSVIEGYIREVSGLNAIPEQYRDKVYGYAHEHGHSAGYSETYNILLDLVSIFEFELRRLKPLTTKKELPMHKKSN